MTTADRQLSVPLLSVKGLVKHFPVKKGLLQRTVGQVHAVDGISFEIAERETLGLVGESGCGKSTAGKTILKLLEPTEGEIRIKGERIGGQPRRGGCLLTDPFTSKAGQTKRTSYATFAPEMLELWQRFAAHRVLRLGPFSRSEA